MPKCLIVFKYDLTKSYFFVNKLRKMFKIINVLKFTVLHLILPNLCIGLEFWTM